MLLPELTDVPNQYRMTRAVSENVPNIYFVYLYNHSLIKTSMPASLPDPTL